MLPTRADDPYIAWRPPFPDLDLRVGNSALLVVDMQYRSAHPDHGMALRLRAAGFEDAYRDYVSRLRLIVPNISRLQAAFRDAGMEVIHVRIRSMTPDGRDRGRLHKKLGHSAPPSSMETEILAELAPLPNELVFDKTSGSVFCATNLQWVLRNMGIENLVVCGVVTTGCVHTAVTDGADLGFHVGLVEDACGAIVPAMHDASVRILRDVYAKVMSTDEVVARCAAAVTPRALV